MTVAHELVGVGIGPANLSLAALLARSPVATSIFLDDKPAFSWHAALMMPGAQTQVHFLKDLVTLVDPTSPYTFLAFLASKRRLYRALITGQVHVFRRELEEYYAWVAGQLPDLRFGVHVDCIEWSGSRFAVQSDAGLLTAHNVVCGVGLRPKLPECVQGHDPERVFHASTLLDRRQPLRGRRIALVGGGQTGAEVALYLLDQSRNRPVHVTWGTSRSNILPLDDSPFTNELFLPNYSRYFYDLPKHERESLLKDQRLASDGVSSDLLQALYRRLYELEFVEGVGRRLRIVPDHRLVGVEDRGDELVVTWRSTRSDSVHREVVDVVICATGYEHSLPAPLAGLRGQLLLRDGKPVVRSDFSLDWKGPPENRIFVQNAAKHAFGIADPNLSLLAWRSAVIVNRLAGMEVYDTRPVSTAIDWTPLTESVEPSAVGQADTWLFN